MTFIDWVTIIIIPVLVIANLFSQSGTFENPLSKRNKVFIITSIAIVGFSIPVGLQNKDDRDSLDTQLTIISNRQQAADSLLGLTRDTLVLIGLKTNNITGELLVTNKELLQRSFNQVITHNFVNTTVTEFPQKDNFQFSVKNNVLYLSPKVGKWGNAFVAFDTSASESVQALVNDAYGTSMDNELFKININNRIYNTRMIKIIGKPVWKDSAIKVDIKNYNKYIIFGDEGTNARYIYQSGNVTWIPEN